MVEIRKIASGLEFPEGPVAMPDGSVILVEIKGGRLTEVRPDGSKRTVAEIPGGPNGAALGPDGKIYICNNGGFTWREGAGRTGPIGVSADYVGGSIQRVDLDTGVVETLFTHCGDDLLRGPNDLVFDAQGGLWFTDTGKWRARDMDFGAVYYIKPGMTEVVQVIAPVLPPNGIGLSPDEKTLYVAETPTARLWAFDLPEPGVIAPITPIYRGEKGRPLAGLGGYQMLDSLALEADGNICVGTLVTGCISVISPDGETIEQIMTGDPATTNICFGGPGLRTAYLTLSGSGVLVSVTWPRPGLALNFLNK